MIDSKNLILFIIPPSCGGAERVTLTIAKLLWHKSNNVKIVIIGKERGEIQEFIPSYIDVVFLRISNIWDFTTMRLIRLFKKQKPNTTFCSLMYLNSRVIVASKIVGGIKTIVRNNNSIDSVGIINRFLIKTTYPFADEIILQTEEMKCELIASKLRVEPFKLHVIFNPIDKDTIDKKVLELNPLKSQTYNYVFVGRIEYVKGLDILIVAFSHVLKTNPNSFLYIIGKIDSNYAFYKSIKQQIKELEIESNVIWVGFSDNPYQYMKYADCVVLPSRREGLPNVILESMYLRTLVVVTRSVPIIDQIVSEDRGIVVDVENVDQLAEAMMKIRTFEKPSLFQQSSNSLLYNIFNT